MNPLSYAGNILSTVMRGSSPEEIPSKAWVPEGFRKPKISTAEQLLQAARERLMNAGGAARMKMREQLEQGYGGQLGDGTYYPEDTSAVADYIRKTVPASQLVGMRRPDAGSVNSVRVVPGIGHMTEIQAARGYTDAGKVMTGNRGRGSVVFGGPRKPATFDGKTKAQFFGQAAARQGEDNKYARAEKTGEVDKLGNPKFTSKAIPKGNTATSERIYEAIKSGSVETTHNKPSNAKPAAKNAEKPATTKRANKPIDNEDVTVTDAIMTGRMPNVAYAAPIRSEPPQASAKNGEMSIDTMYETYHPEMILESARQEYARTGDDSGLREHLRRFPSEATRLSQEETQIWQQMVKEGADIEAAQQAQMAAFNEREKAIKENSFGILGSGAAARAWEAKNPEKAALLKKPLPKRDRALIEQANRKSAQFEEARKAQMDFIYDTIKKGGEKEKKKKAA